MISFPPQVCRSEDFFEDSRFYSGALDTLTGLVLIPVSPSRESTRWKYT
jgi:hypothetical protein